MSLDHAHAHDHGGCCPSCSGHACAEQRPEDAAKARRDELIKLGAAMLMAAAGMIFWKLGRMGTGPRWLAFPGIALELSAYLLAGWDVLKGAAKNILRGRVMDELFLMAIASLGAFIIGATEEAIGVMVFYRVGEMLQDAAADKSRRSIRALLALRPDTARVQRDGQWIPVDPDEVRPGELVLVRPGERVPVDGEVTEGLGSLDTASMTGESEPRPAGPGDEALAGFIARDAALTIRALRPAAQSSAAKIVELVEHAAQRKARTELFITRFARWYTPMVVIASALLAFLPPILVPGERLADWVYRALVMLVISCPCAFVVSVPLGYFGGLGGAAKRGILIKGASILDALADARTVVFDKTGTLTDGTFSVLKLSPAGAHDGNSLLMHAAAAGTHSNHPLAKAVRAAWKETGQAHPDCETDSYAEIPGHGTRAVLRGREILAGSDRILHMHNIAHPCSPARGTEMHVAVGGDYAGRIDLGDSLKPDGKSAVDLLRAMGVRRVAMLTGDSEKAAERAGREAGMDEVHHGLLPAGKLDKLEEIMRSEDGASGGRRGRSGRRGTVLFVGDGVNDAPVLARADAGIAMGLGGADAALESADVVLMSDEPSRVPEAIARARRTRLIVIQNIALALGVKLAFLSFGAFGLAAMWEAVIADVGVALLAVLNSTRALK